ncbi:MAG: NAD(P)-binding domain-containing protein [Actinomycetota bacterium]|nr:NAD(P)-binding domain-containing protein [Actinomycetota bacterium]
MRIAIIGAGNIGGTLTRRLTALGHEVHVANSRAPATLSELATETGATAVWASQAATGADLVIISIPQKNVPDLAPGIVSTAKPGAAIIETNNYYPKQRDGLIAEIEAGIPESMWVSRHLGVPVIKVFNGIFWKHLLEKGMPSGTSERIALPVAGADGRAKQAVFDLVDQLGFDPVDGGSLDESWHQQPGTPVYGKDYNSELTLKALAAATAERPAEFRA